MTDAEHVSSEVNASLCFWLIFVVMCGMLLKLSHVLCRWNTYVVDGHDVEELCKAFWQAQQVKGKPTCIVAKTFKGKGLKSKCGVVFICEK